jgi:hypothetical protein
VKKLTSLSCLAFLYAAASLPVAAHHSNAPHFDSTKPISIEGVVTEFQFVNPHAWVYLDVTGADGQVENWNCELSAASGYRRQGWTEELFAVGSVLKIDGIAARRDPLGCSYSSGTLADGTVVARGGQITNGEAVLSASVENEVGESVDLTAMAGTWISTPRQRGGGGGGGAPQSGDPAVRYADQVTEAGMTALLAYDQRFDDPALECSPSSITRGWSEPNGPSEFAETEDQIVIRHEYMDTVRTVDLTTRTHPANIEPSLTGHSVGWYEGDTLVIETVGFEEGVLVPHPGLVHSDEMKIVERLTLAEEGNLLLRAYEVTDPKYFTKPYTGNSSWTRSDIPVSPYNCVELGGISNIRQD